MILRSLPKAKSLKYQKIPETELDWTQLLSIIIMPRYADDEYVNRAMPGATAVAGMSSRGGGGEDERVKSDEAALRQVANTGGVGAFAVAQAAPGGRRQPGRVRRSASARMRARQRAGLDAVAGNQSRRFVGRGRGDRTDDHGRR